MGETFRVDHLEGNQWVGPEVCRWTIYAAIISVRDFWGHRRSGQRTEQNEEGWLLRPRGCGLVPGMEYKLVF